MRGQVRVLFQPLNGLLDTLVKGEGARPERFEGGFHGYEVVLGHARETRRRDRKGASFHPIEHISGAAKDFDMVGMEVRVNNQIDSVTVLGVAHKKASR